VIARASYTRQLLCLELFHSHHTPVPDCATSGPFEHELDDCFLAMGSFGMII